MFVHLSNFGEINAYLEPQMPWWLCNEAGCCCLEYYVTLCPGLPSPLLPRWRTKPNKRISNLFRISELWRSMLAKNPNSGILGQLCHRFRWLQHLNRMTQEFIVWVSRHLTWKIRNDQRCCTSDLSASSRDSNTRQYQYVLQNYYEMCKWILIITNGTTSLFRHILRLGYLFWSVSHNVIDSLT